jgi:hypothetical protein
MVEKDVPMQQDFKQLQNSRKESKIPHNLNEHTIKTKYIWMVILQYRTSNLSNTHETE